MPSICELKIELKSKGIKGISGLNKSGLEALLKGGKSAEKKVEKPKVFTPAPTKGATPVVAEKQIDKKIKPPKMLMLTNKPIKEKKQPKPPKKTEEEKVKIKKLKEELKKCKAFFKKAGINSEVELKKYITKNHPDKKTYANQKEADLYKEISNCYSVIKELDGTVEIKF
jgi:hypothetical protein